MASTLLIFQTFWCTFNPCSQRTVRNVISASNPFLAAAGSGTIIPWTRTTGAIIPIFVRQLSASEGGTGEGVSAASLPSEVGNTS